MMRRKLAIVPALLLLAGCTDTADSIAREYRNANNEGIDAMMMITDNNRAKRMTSRVLKPLQGRYEAISKRLEIWKSNRATNKELVQEIYSSDSVHLYLAELPVNRQRFTLEMTRLRNLVNQYIEREQALRREEGKDEFDFDPKELCPDLYDLVNNPQVLDPLRKQLDKGELVREIEGFNNIKVADYPKLHEIFRAKREVFAPKQEFELVMAPEIQK